MPRFERKPDHELDRLDDEALVAYARAARDAGDPAAAARAIAVLVYGYWSNVERRVRMKVPREHVEDVTADIVASAIQSAFDGTSTRCGTCSARAAPTAPARVDAHCTLSSSGSRVSTSPSSEEQEALAAELTRLIIHWESGTDRPGYDKAAWAFVQEADVIEVGGRPRVPGGRQVYRVVVSVPRDH